jgi:hypothetical protein
VFAPTLLLYARHLRGTTLRTYSVSHAQTDMLLSSSAQLVASLLGPHLNWFCMQNAHARRALCTLLYLSNRNHLWIPLPQSQPPPTTHRHDCNDHPRWLGPRCVHRPGLHSRPHNGIPLLWHGSAADW